MAITKKQIAVIHIAKAKTGMSDDAYLDMLRSMGVGSSTELDQSGFDEIMRRFKSGGFKRVHSSAKKSGMHRDPALENRRLLEKIGALLADMKLPWSYADAIARRMYRIEKVRWCGAEQLRGIVVALLKKQEKIPEKETMDESGAGERPDAAGR